MSESMMQNCRNTLERAEMELRGLCAVLGIAIDGAHSAWEAGLSDVLMSIQLTTEGIYEKVESCVKMFYPNDSCQRADKD